MMSIPAYNPFSAPKWVKVSRDGQWGIYCPELGDDTFAARASELDADQAIEKIERAVIDTNAEGERWHNSPEHKKAVAQAAAKARHERCFATSRRGAQA